MSNKKLTQREKEVFYYMCLGYNNVKIAKILNISKYTSKAHVSHILKKLGVENRTSAAYIAGKESLVNLDDSIIRKT